MGDEESPVRSRYLYRSWKWSDSRVSDSALKTFSATLFFVSWGPGVALRLSTSELVFHFPGKRKSIGGLFSAFSTFTRQMSLAWLWLYRSQDGLMTRRSIRPFLSRKELLSGATRTRIPSLGIRDNVRQVSEAGCFGSARRHWPRFI